MDENKGKLKYRTFTFEEFLMDEYFISSIRKPNNDSQLFWKDFVESHPFNLEEFNLAILFLDLSHEEHKLLSEKKVSLLWNKISTTKTTHKNNKKRYYIIAITVAASIAILFSLPFLNSFNRKQAPTDLINFARSLPEITSSEETQLIISNNKIFNLEEKESTVNYESSTIKIQKEEISKSDISEYNQIITPKGKRSVLTLHDGSKIWINAGSRVVYPKEFTEKRREIYVEGEIFANIRKDDYHPFIVYTSKMNIEVLGTTFNVSAYSDESEHSLALVSGSVLVKIGSKTKTTLKPNQLLTYSKESYTVHNVDVSPYVSWKNGLYKFKGVALSKVFGKLSKYYGKKIICNSKIKDIKCSGMLDLKDDIETVLEDLAFMIPFEVKQNNESYIITKPSK